MRDRKVRFLCRFLQEERGQTAVLITAMSVAIMAMSAMGIETGHVYYAYRMLQASTNAATLAAAEAMPDIGTQSAATAGTAWGNLIAYGSATESGVTGLNSTSMLSNASISANFYCSSTMAGAPFNVGCATPPSGEGSCTSSTCNAVKVTQTAQVNLWFGGLVGFRSFSLTANSSAAMRGGNHPPYNIAVILDTTSSMGTCPTKNGKNQCDVDCPPSGSYTSEIACAVSGLSDMLTEMYPCVGGGACNKNSQYADAVSLFVFPALSAASSDASTDYSKDYCNGGDSSVPYNFINVTTGSLNLNMQGTKGQTDAGTYQIIPFDQAYKQNDTDTVLYSSDYLAQAVGTGCSGLTAPGGQGTYYAQVIYAAQAGLVAQQTAESKAGQKTLNVLIILTDGDSNAGNSNAYTGGAAGGVTNKGNQIVALSGTLNGTCTSSKSGCSNTNYATYSYPSAIGQCGQAVQAAQAATAAGTIVYTVAMGSPISGSCTTDAGGFTLSNLSNGAETWPTGAYPGQACNAIRAMASSASTFFSDNTGGCAAFTQNSSYTTIGTIFDAVSKSLTNARLIPNGT